MCTGGDFSISRLAVRKAGPPLRGKCPPLARFAGLPARGSDLRHFARRWRSVKMRSLPPWRGQQDIRLWRLLLNPSPRWGAPFEKGSLLQSQLHVICAKSLGTRLRLRRFSSQSQSRSRSHQLRHHCGGAADGLYRKRHRLISSKLKAESSRPRPQ